MLSSDNMEQIPLQNVIESRFSLLPNYLYYSNNFSFKNIFQIGLTMFDKSNL